MTLEEKQNYLYSHCSRMNACGKCALNDNSEAKRITSNHYDCCEFDEMTDSELETLVKIAKGETVEADPVNKAIHYNQGGIECIKAIEASMSPEEYAGFLKGQVIKYVWRYRHKGKPVEDLKKARYYLDELIRITEGKETDSND